MCKPEKSTMCVEKARGKGKKIAFEYPAAAVLRAVEQLRQPAFPGARSTGKCLAFRQRAAQHGTGQTLQWPPWHGPPARQLASCGSRGRIASALRRHRHPRGSPLRHLSLRQHLQFFCAWQGRSVPNRQQEVVQRRHRWPTCGSGRRRTRVVATSNEREHKRLPVMHAVARGADELAHSDDKLRALILGRGTPGGDHSVQLVIEVNVPVLDCGD